MESIEIVVVTTATATDEAEEEYKKQPGTIHCPVCLEPTPPHPTPVCPQHSIFCTECLKTYMTLHVSENNVPLVCLDPECNNPIDNHHVQRLTSPNMYKKYQKFLQLKRDPSLRECTNCEHLNHALGTTTTMTCALCSHCWCSEHGDLHPNKTCKQYLEEMAPSIKQELLLSEQTIQDSSKPCPNCHVPIFKGGGCDHIVCSSCDKDFCFKCGTDLHMTGTVIRNCSKCGGSYFDHRHQSTVQCRVIASCPLWFPLYLVYTAFAIFLATITCGCGCMCQCGKGLDFDEQERLDGKTRGDCCDLFRCVGQVLFAPLIQVCMFFPSMHCCIKCCFTKSTWAKLGFGGDQER